MKRSRNLCVIIVCFLLSVWYANASEIASIGYRIEQLRTQIESQIEKIRAAREQADSTMAVEQVRVVEQLVRSEEDLTRQIEALQQFREHLRDQMRESQAEVKQVAKDWNTLFGKAFAEIDEQIVATRNMLKRVSAVKEQITGDCLEGSCREKKEPPSSPTETTGATKRQGLRARTSNYIPPPPPPAPQAPVAGGG